MSADRPTLSMIVPCWNDVHALGALLRKLAADEGPDELIVGDASSGVLAEEITKLCHDFGVKLVAGLDPNRGSQMNAAARLACGDILLFQHADSEVDGRHLEALRFLGRNGGVAGGGYYRKFDARHPHLRWLEGVNRWLSRNGGTIYGDQSIFVRRAVFEQMGGFAAIPLMEDVDFSRRLRRAGKVVLLDPPVSTSARRSARRGSWRTSVENGLLLTLFHLGVSPVRLHGWYYRHRLGAG